MHPTRNDLSAKTRGAVIKQLGELSIDAVDLFTQIKQAHWNVKGANFIAIHELFDKVAEEAEDWGDDLAERIVQLGGTALGSSRVVAKGTTLPEYPAGIVHSSDHVEAVSNVLAIFGKKIRAGIDACDKLGDKGSADLCTGISRGVDKYLWFVESHGKKFE